MNKYNLLWKHVKKKSGLSLKLSFDEIEKIAILVKQRKNINN